ncbi:MAG: glycosyltransferase family 2 protein [Spirochaetes bacterium]|nr:MAG: glycosyltransferase family 2 protein [Spirochaetota bacterium]
MDDIKELLFILAAIGALNVLTAATIIIRKLGTTREKEKDIDLTDFLVNTFETVPEDQNLKIIDNNPYAFLDRFIRLSQSAILNQDFKDKVIRYMRRAGIQDSLIKRLRSWRTYKRTHAAVMLCYIPSIESKRALEGTLVREKHYYIKLHMAYSLIQGGAPSSLRIVALSCKKAPLWYTEKIASLLTDTGRIFYDLIPELLRMEDRDLQLLIINFASFYPDEVLKQFLLGAAVSRDRGVALPALKSLFSRYPNDSELDLFFNVHDEEILKAAIQFAGNIPTSESMMRLAPFLEQPGLYEPVVESLSRIIFKEDSLVLPLVRLFHEASGPEISSGIAEALLSRIEFFLVRLLSDKSGKTVEIVYEIIKAGKASGVTAFLKRNMDESLEDEVLNIMRLVVMENPELGPVFSVDLNERQCEKLGLRKIEPPKPVARKEFLERGILISLILLAFLFIPSLFLAIYARELSLLRPFDLLMRFIDTFNISFALYALVINSSYILLLFLSFAGAVKQTKNFALKQMNFLFQQKILPSVSIIAPAYNEEAGIIESVSSLLNLRYPDYEVVVVNDGSKDRTLETLIEHFKLEKDDTAIHSHISTMRVRGTYFNRNVPNLLVIDKENGGKADSLNVGINASRKEYFCGIDADSLLESDSLIKLMSQFLDSDTEGVAAGGNIFPVNGCSVDNGAITHIGLPANRLARLQMVEYIRSFMGGRIGWAFLRALLIISGAFGVFKRERVIEAGGYLTGRGAFAKDTVGEDMELVVRMARFMHERKLPFRIYYAFNANCWTEVPENFKIFKRQRDRWHRGLLDIMTFHKKLLFNPGFGRIGLLASPYFLIFEVIGPWIELQGYFVFAVSCVLGLISATSFILLFIGSVMMGIFISLFSFFIMEKEVNYFSLKEIAGMLWYAFIENFGIRQVLSMMRVSSYLNALKTSQGWGVMVRKGFTTSKK